MVSEDEKKLRKLVVLMYWHKVLGGDLDNINWKPEHAEVIRLVEAILVPK